MASAASSFVEKYSIDDFTDYEVGREAGHDELIEEDTGNQGVEGPSLEADPELTPAKEEPSPSQGPETTNTAAAEEIMEVHRTLRDLFCWRRDEEEPKAATPQFHGSLGLALFYRHATLMFTMAFTVSLVTMANWYYAHKFSGEFASPLSPDFPILLCYPNVLSTFQHFQHFPLKPRGWWCRATSSRWPASTLSARRPPSGRSASSRRPK